MIKKRYATALAVLTGLALPASAAAHISLHPNTIPTGAFVTLDIRVPNEMVKTNTVKLAVQLPPGFIDASTGYLPGWTSQVKLHKLSKPVKTPDGPITEEVSEIIWTGHGGQGKIPPSEFMNFPISVEMPGKAGQVLTFKALQYYDNGQIVRWIGPPDAAEPAPTVDITPKGGVIEDVAGGEAGPAGQAASSASNPTASGSSGASKGASKGLAITALVVGALGLLGAGTALLMVRRRPASAPGGGGGAG